MARLAAWACLRSGSPTPLRELERVARERGLDARDRALARRLVGTEVRRRGTLRALVAHFSRFKPKPDLAAHLHLGLVQLLFLDRIPDRAAVSESATAVHETLGPSKVRYANALLRTAARARCEGTCGDPRRDVPGRDLHFEDPIFRDPREHPLLWFEDALNLPAPLAKRWVRRYGAERAEALARLALDEPALSVRVARGGADEVALELAPTAGEPARAAHPSILRYPSSAAPAVLGSPAFSEGRVSVQGETALRAAELVEACAGERVLDLCAAPGGKTAVLAAAGARVVACDVDGDKLALLRSTLERLGVAEHVETRRSDVADAGEPYDAVLVDAPCSNTGVLGARPSARWRFGTASMRSLAELQVRLLERGAERVRPGGRLVWSTCSLEPDENERRVRELLERRPDFELEAELSAFPEPAPGPVDGGAAFRLRRRGA